MDREKDLFLFSSDRSVVLEVNSAGGVRERDPLFAEPLQNAKVQRGEHGILVPDLADMAQQAEIER